MPPVPKKKQAESGSTQAITWPFGRANYIWFGIAVLVIVIGYISLGSGSITLAPLLLVIGYCVLIPFAIMVKDKGEKPAAQAADSAASDTPRAE